MATDTPTPTDADVQAGYELTSRWDRDELAGYAVLANMIATEFARVRAETRQQYLDLADNYQAEGEARRDLGSPTWPLAVAERIRAI